MTATTSKQLTFVDTTESGLIDIGSARQQVSKLHALKPNNRTLIKNAFCYKFQMTYFDFDRLLGEETKFTTEQFYDFREAIQYYADREKHPQA